MYASKVSAAALERAAYKVGVTVDITSLSDTRHRVKVNPGTKVLKNGDHKYQRISASYFSRSRKVHAVCWHGFRDFFREVFKHDPQTVFRTGLDTWKGSADFEARYRESGHRNVGPPISPIAMVDTCRCPEAGEAN